MVSKRVLLVISALVWTIAGFNVVRLGMMEYHGYSFALFTALTLITFLPFGFMFHNMVRKNTIRILSFTQDKIFFLKFFPIRSYIIISVMMTLGIILRNNEHISRYFISFFYIGLGSALFLAGVKFLLNAVRYESLAENTKYMINEVS